MSLKNFLFKNIYKIHTYLGLFVAFHFVLFSISGLALLFKDEIQGKKEVVQNSIEELPNSLSQKYERAFLGLTQKYPQDRILALYPDERDPQVLNARIGLNGSTQFRGARKTNINLASGIEIVAPPTTVKSGFFHWILVLHRELFLGSNGKIYVGFVGMAYVIMLISGFFLYGNFMKTREFGEIRSGRIPKLVDLHKFVGVVSFGWGLIVGVSGVFLAFNGILIKLFQSNSLKYLSHQYQDFQAGIGTNAPFHKVIETALEIKAHSVISYISFPGTEYGIAGHYLVLVHGSAPLTEQISELLVINSKTAHLTEALQLPLYLKAAILSEPLHFGNYGGLFLKLIWACFALCSLAVVLFGLTSFFMKRSKVKYQKKPQADSKVNSQSHIKPKLSRFLKKNRYLVPITLASLSTFSLITTLISQGKMRVLATAILLIPLSTVIFGRKENA